MPDWVKKLLLLAWGAGLAAFLTAGVLGRGLLLLCISVGVISAALAPIWENEGMSRAKITKTLRPAANLAYGMLVCYGLAAAWSVFYARIIAWEMEPISFGLAYAALHTAGAWIIQRLRSLQKGDTHEQN